MKATPKEEKLILETYRKLYQACDVDFDNLPEKDRHSWFIHYYVPQERQDIIIHNATLLGKLPKHRKQAFINTIALGCSPCGAPFRYELKSSTGTVVFADKVKWEASDGVEYTLPKFNRRLRLLVAGSWIRFNNLEVLDEHFHSTVKLKGSDAEYTLTRFSVEL